MAEYSVFLRGINVGGIRVPMPELRTVLEGIGARDVTTWLATGNVRLTFDGTVEELVAASEKAIGEAFNYNAYVLVRSADELANIVATWPYSADDTAHRYVVFGGVEAWDEVSSVLADDGVEAASVSGKELLWRCPKGSSTATPVAKVLAKKKYKAVTTTRNLNTIEKMLG